MARGARNAVGAPGAAQREGGRGRGPSRGRPRIADGTGGIPVGRGRWGRCAEGGQARDERIETRHESVQGPDADQSGSTPGPGHQKWQAEEKGEHEGLPDERWQEYT